MSTKDRMNSSRLGGIIHTYQKYDPVEFPSPTAAAAGHGVAGLRASALLRQHAPAHRRGTGPRRPHRPQPDSRPRTEPRLPPGDAGGAQAQDPRNLRNRPGPSTRRTQLPRPGRGRCKPPSKLHGAFHEAVHEEQFHDLEHLWYRTGDEPARSPASSCNLIERLGEKYQVDELASKYEFTGRTPMNVPKALEIKQELEMIDKLLKQIEEAAKTAQIGIIDLEELAQFAEPGDIEQLGELQQQIQEYLRQMREQQGIEEGKQRLSDDAEGVSAVSVEAADAHLRANAGVALGPAPGADRRRRRHRNAADEALRVRRLRAHMDIPASFTNALLRTAPGLPVRLKTEDIVIHKTRNNPKCASAVLLDMSGSMRYDGLYVNVKRMGLALDGLIRTEYPGDFLQFIEMYTFAKPRHISEVAALMPKPVTIYDPVVRARPT